MLSRALLSALIALLKLGAPAIILLTLANAVGQGLANLGWLWSMAASLAIGAATLIAMAVAMRHHHVGRPALAIAAAATATMVVPAAESLIAAAPGWPPKMAEILGFFGRPSVIAAIVATAAASVAAVVALVAAAGLGKLGAAALGVAAGRKGWRRSKSEVHGSARLGNSKEYPELFSQPAGVNLAADPASPVANPLIARLNSSAGRHALIIGATGSGKGVGPIASTLLIDEDGSGGWIGSALVIDPKGESWAITAASREAAGHDVVIFDPLSLPKLRNISGRRVKINPFDLVKRGVERVYTTRIIAAALKKPSPGDKQHFIEVSLTGMEGFIALVCAEEEELYYKFSETVKRKGANGEDVYELVEHEGIFDRVATFGILPRSLEGVREMYMQFAIMDEFDKRVLLKVLSHIKGGDGLIRNMAAKFISTRGDELSGLQSSIERDFKFLDDARIADALSYSDVDLNELVDGKLSLFICLPTGTKDMIPIIQILTCVSVHVLKSAETPPNPAVLFLIDELTALGPLLPILDPSTGAGALTEARGYGLRILAATQDLSQLEVCYSKAWKTWIANCDLLLLGLGAADRQTAEHFSAILGKTTVENTSESRNTGGSAKGTDVFGTTSHGQSESTSVVARPVMTPDEILNMKDDQCIFFSRGRRPLLLRKLQYFKVRKMLTVAARNPYHGEE